MNVEKQQKIIEYIHVLFKRRLVNAGGIHSLNIVDPFSKKGDKCDVYEIARDGVYLKRPKQPQGGSMLLPGGRVDWILQCNEPGTYKVKGLKLVLSHKIVFISSYFVSFS